MHFHMDTKFGGEAKELRASTPGTAETAETMHHDSAAAGGRD